MAVWDHSIVWQQCTSTADGAPSDWQPHYENGVLGNVYLLALHRLCSAGQYRL